MKSGISCGTNFEMFMCTKVKVLLILPWIATSTNEVGFHIGPAFPSPAIASTGRLFITAGKSQKWDYELLAMKLEQHFLVIVGMCCLCQHQSFIIGMIHWHTNVNIVEGDRALISLPIVHKEPNFHPCICNIELGKVLVGSSNSDLIQSCMFRPGD